MSYLKPLNQRTVAANLDIAGAALTAALMIPNSTWLCLEGTFVAFDVTLPTVAQMVTAYGGGVQANLNGMTFTFKRDLAQLGVVRILPGGADFIDGVNAAGGGFSLAAVNDSVTLGISAAANWVVI